MSEQEFDLYLRLLSRCLSLSSQQRTQIADELRDHLEERLEELARAGVPREKAVFQALDEFGDAAVLATHFSTIAHLKRRRFLMRLSLGSVAALAATIVIAFAFWPENRAVQGPPPLFAQDNLKAAHPALAKPSLSPALAAPKSQIPSPVTTDEPLSSDVGQNPGFERALDSTVDFTIDPEPLTDALDFIAARYQIPVLLDKKALEEANVDATTRVKLPVSGIKLRQMLTLLLEQLPQQMGFDIQDGVLRITTMEKIREHRVVVVYDCRDLIQLRSMNPGTAVPQRTEGSQEAHGTGMFDVSPTMTGKTAAEKAKEPNRGGPTETSEKAAEPAKTRSAQPAIPLIRVIRYAGDQEDWQDEEGGGDQRITELGGLLVVNQNPMVHEQIKRILADLRRMRKAGAFAPLEKDHAGPSTTSAQGGTRGGL